MEVVVEVPPPKTVGAMVPIRPAPAVLIKSNVELSSCFVQLQLFEVTHASTHQPSLLFVRDGLDGEEFSRLHQGRAVFNNVRIVSRQPGGRWQAVIRYLLLAAPDRGGLLLVDNVEAWSLPFVVDETAPVPSNFRLDLLIGPTGVVFKETRIHLKVKLSPVGSQPVTMQEYFKLGVSLEDEHSVPIRTIAAGPHMGEPILSRVEYDTPLNGRWELDINDIRIREVSRNHGGAAFRILVHLLEFPHVPPAVSALFYVRSERIRAPSYAAQLQSQREQRAARVKDAPAGTAADRDRDRDDPASRASNSDEEEYTDDEEE